MHFNTEFESRFIHILFLLLTQIISFEYVTEAFEVALQILILVAEAGGHRDDKEIHPQHSSKKNPPQNVGDDSHNVGQV